MRPQFLVVRLIGRVPIQSNLVGMQLELPIRIESQSLRGSSREAKSTGAAQEQT